MCEKDIVVGLKSIYRDVCNALEEIRTNDTLSVAQKNVEMQLLLWQVKDAIEEYSSHVTKYNMERMKIED